MDLAALTLPIAVLVLFTFLGVFNWYTLYRAPTRFPAKPAELLTLRVARGPSEVTRALEGLRCFELRRRAEQGGEVMLVLSAPLTLGVSGRRTRGHWVFVRVRPEEDGAAVDVAITSKGWEGGTWARTLRAERHGKAAGEVRARLGL